MASALLPSALLRLLPFVAAAIVATSSGASAEGPTLDSREYKLMLEPAMFAGAPQPIVNRFWNEELKRVIAQRLGRRNDGEPRHKGAFGAGPERFIQFRDTKECLLNSHGYTLRERTRLKDGRRELTIKFRTPDIFLAAQSWVGTAGKNVKLEEDIAPLIERTVTASGKISAAYARPPTMRSLFSQSVTQRMKPGLMLRSLPDVISLHPKLEGALRNAAVGSDALQAPLLPGERFHERVFTAARVELGDKTDGKFDLSLWYPADKVQQAQPVLAEISFKYDTDDGAVKKEVSWRALVLFRAMQEMLGGWTSPERETKASMALPESCRN